MELEFENFYLMGDRTENLIMEKVLVVKNNLNTLQNLICNTEIFIQPYGKYEMKVEFSFRKGFYSRFG